MGFPSTEQHSSIPVEILGKQQLTATYSKSNSDDIGDRLSDS